MRTLRLALLLFGLLCGKSASPQQPLSADKVGYDFSAEPKKLALVIGNSTYDKLGPLPSATVDAENVARKLRSIGFDVAEHYDVKSVDELEEDLLPALRKKIGKGDLVVFYFSGHGFAYGQGNYLAPVNLPLAMQTSEVGRKAVALESVEDYLTQKSPGVLLLIVDACRTIANFTISDPGAANQVAKGPREPTRFNVFNNTVAAYASRPGFPAIGSSALGRMSFFTAELARLIATEGVEFEPMFKDVSVAVQLATNDEQQPGVFNWSTADLYMQTTAVLQSQEHRAWMAALTTGRLVDIQYYLKRHTLSPYAVAARKWIDDHPAGGGAVPFSSVSPQAVEASWDGRLDGTPVELPRSNAPLAFSPAVDLKGGVHVDATTLGVSQANLTPLEALGLDKANSSNINAQLANYRIQRDAVLITAEVGRTAPSFSAPMVLTSGPITGSSVRVAEVIRRSGEGAPWVAVADANIRSDASMVYYPVRQADVSNVLVGASLLEVQARALRDGLSDLVEKSDVVAALVDLKRQGRKIIRVSLATGSTADERESLDRKGRANDVALLLMSNGVAADAITSVSSVPDITDGSVRVRFFGT